MNKPIILHLINNRNQKIIMEYKIKHQDGTSIIEDIGGGVSI